MTEDNKPKSTWITDIATGSLILGIIALVTCGLTSIPGLILGVISIILIIRSKRSVTGLGRALVGAILNAVMLVVFSFIIIWQVQVEDDRDAGFCSTRIKAIGIAFQMYASDYDSCLPPAENWVDLLRPYANREIYFICPSARSNQIGYAMNKNLSGMNLNELEDSPGPLVLVYDAIENDSHYGGPELIPSPERHIRYSGLDPFTAYKMGRLDQIISNSRVNNYCLINCRTKFMTNQQTSSLIWKPVKK